MPQTALMLSGMEAVNMAQTEVSTSPVVNEEINPDLAAPSHVVAGIVCQHFGFDDLAKSHFAQLQGTILENFPRGPSPERDVILATAVEANTDKPQLARVLAAEIKDPLIAMSAFELLYSQGDGPSFEPFISVMEQYVNWLLATGTADYLNIHLDSILHKLDKVYAGIYESELKQARPMIVDEPIAPGQYHRTTRVAIYGYALGPKMERVRDIQLKILRTQACLCDTAPPAGVQDFVATMEAC